MFLVMFWDGIVWWYVCCVCEIGDVKLLNLIDLGVFVLCGMFVGMDEDVVCVGCFDGSVRFVDFKIGAFCVVGVYDDGVVLVVEYDDVMKKLFMFGWD